MSHYLGYMVNGTRKGEWVGGLSLRKMKLII